MKKITLFSALAAIILASCAGNPEGKKAEVKDSVELSNSELVGTSFTLDTAASKLIWTGTKVSGEHTGTVDFKSGALNVDKAIITGGNFVLDMNTISSTDLEGEFKGKLDGHLKADDFFGAETFPEASFSITEVKPGAIENDLIISGNLVIKGISKNITFNSKIAEVSETTLKADADFNIVREDWGVSYAGKADDLISKEINFKISIVANK